MTSKSLLFGTVVLAIAITSAPAVLSAGGAPQAPAAAKPPELATVPVRVDVTLSRYQGDKKTSSLPFSLYASAGPQMRSQVSMRMGIDVPIGTVTSNESRTTPNGQATRTTGTNSTTTEYRNVGTNIDSYVIRTDDTHYSVYVSVNDSSIYTADGDAKTLKGADSSAFRTFSTSNTVVLRDGQTLLFGTGTDKVSGEVLKIEVTLTVIK